MNKISEDEVREIISEFLTRSELEEVTQSLVAIMQKIVDEAAA